MTRSSLEKAFGTDEKAEAEGVYIDLVENADGTMGQLKIRRMNQGNLDFVQAMAKHRKSFGIKRTPNRTELKKIRDSLTEVYATTVVVGWRNIEDWEAEAEDPIYKEYSVDNVRKMLIKFDSLMDLIDRESSDIENFQEKEDELKN